MKDRYGPFEIFCLAVVVFLVIWGIVTLIQAL